MSTCIVKAASENSQKISLDEKRITITYNPAKTDEATLAKAIEKCGYTAEKVPAGKAKE